MSDRDDPASLRARRPGVAGSPARCSSARPCGSAAGPAAADQWTAAERHPPRRLVRERLVRPGHRLRVLVPLGICYDTPDLGAWLRAAASARAVHDLDDAPSASMTGFTDTTVSRLLPSAPGGHRDPPRARHGSADRRVPAEDPRPPGGPGRGPRGLQRFGEGFDVNPTVIVYQNFGDWGIGGGVGYLWTGEYDPTKDIPNDDFNPGDELTVSVLGDVFLGDVWRLARPRRVHALRARTSAAASRPSARAPRSTSARAWSGARSPGGPA